MIIISILIIFLLPVQIVKKQINHIKNFEKQECQTVNSAIDRTLFKGQKSSWATYKLFFFGYLGNT